MHNVHQKSGKDLGNDLQVQKLLLTTDDSANQTIRARE